MEAECHGFVDPPGRPRTEAGTDPISLGRICQCTKYRLSVWFVLGPLTRADFRDSDKSKYLRKFENWVARVRTRTTYFLLFLPLPQLTSISGSVS
jgi:hypothetical protein